MIRFKSIRWKNFLSTGNAFTEIDLTTSRTTLILGENGSGKSTLLDAICFALFGRAYREINKPQLLNSVNGKRCEVQVEFVVGKKKYKIIRGIKPTTFEIYVDGDLLNQDAASRDYQKYLEESILKLNFKSFTQIVILGSAGFTPFMQLPAANRRAIIEDILDIQIFTIMNGLLKSKVRETNDLHTQLGRDLELEKQKTLVQEKFIKSLTENKKAQIKEVDKSLADVEKKLESLEVKKVQVEKDLEKLQTTVDEYNAWEKKWDAQDRLKFNLEREVGGLRMGMKTYADSKDCPQCFQPIDEKFKKKHLAKLQKSVDAKQAELDKVLGLMAEYDKHMKKTEPAMDKHEVKTRELNGIESEVRTNQQLQTLYAKQLRELNNKKGNIEEEQTKLKDYARAAIALSKKRQAIGEDKFYLEFVGTLLKDSGIKTKIINQYLPVINKLVNKYLAEMDFYVQFTLDEEFKEVMKSRFRDEFTYASFSEGEKQRIDLALLFTWRTVAKMKNSASTNLLILDEVFDSSLDASATEYVMNLLNTLSTDSHVFVISHKPEALADKFERILRFEKKQNFSILSEDK